MSNCTSAFACELTVWLTAWMTLLWLCNTTMMIHLAILPLAQFQVTFMYINSAGPLLHLSEYIVNTECSAKVPDRKWQTCSEHEPLRSPYIMGTSLCPSV